VASALPLLRLSRWYVTAPLSVCRLNGETHSFFALSSSSESSGMGGAPGKLAERWKRQLVRRGLLRRLGLSGHGGAHSGTA
jgi:hypothetical protein